MNDCPHCHNRVPQVKAARVGGGNLRRIARRLGVVHQTVANWVAAHADALPAQPPQPDGPVETAEIDELYTFVGQKN